jgi:mevalonate kinase
MLEALIFVYIMESTSKAPGKIILFGEHAVVYDKLGIATTVDKYTKVKVSSYQKNIKIISENYNIEKEMKKDEIFNLLEYIEKLREENKIEEIKNLVKGNGLLPSFVVTGKIMEKYGFEPLQIEIYSEVPKNLGSSASVFNAIALGVSKFLGLKLSKEEIGYFANEGDKVVHGTPSGIDAYTIAYGGWVSYKKSEGIKSLKINFEFPLIIVDSGEPAKTGETVGYIKKQKEKNPEKVDSIMNKLDEISYNSLEALKSFNLTKIGNLMLDYYKELRKLGISTQKLDEIVNIALKNNAYAKPTGGWGGGCCVVLSDNIENLMKVYDKLGYKVFKTKLGVDGVK